ncbi:MAG: beta-ketoacyl-[acyl-carrier-protein] synthase II, partial [Myxococcales bacterium]|nr:beta-ketoacyl-[acyl-carrier-protein] synthase II [Myxococcales bacterium]
MRAFPERRVVVTGVGLITPVGVGTQATWRGLLEGRSGIGPITAFDASDFTVQIAGQVPDFDANAWVGKKDARRMDRFIQFSAAAADMALADAGLPSPVPDPEDTGVLIGVGLGGLGTIEEAHEILRTKGPRRLSPFMIPRLIANLAPGTVSMRTGALGPNLGSVSACATGAHSVGDAARLIAMGDAEVMLAGGAEATITPLGVGGFAAMKALSVRNDDPQGASRPFDKDRDGFVCAEGAAVLVLEELGRAKARGARIYAEVAGY